MAAALCAQPHRHVLTEAHVATAHRTPHTEARQGTMESRVQAAEALLARSSGGSNALAAAIAAAELYMAAAASAPSKAQAARLRRRCQELIRDAETLKARRARPDVLRRASRLHGNDFPPWDAEPADAEFERRPGADLYV